MSGRLRLVLLLAFVLLAPQALLAQLAITTVTPAAVEAGTGPITITVDGGGFVTGSIVQWWRFGDVPPINLPTVFVNGARLRATIAADLIGTATVVRIRVRNPSSALSNPILFLVNPPPLAITTTSPLPDGTRGVFYNTNLAATGGFPPYGWGLVSGLLPTGLDLTASGSITGTPTAVGTFTFTIRLFDNAQTEVDRVFTLTINNPGPLGIATTSPLPTGTVGESYFQPLAGTGGVPLYTWLLTDGLLPPGLFLSTLGVIEGVPSQQGTFSFEITIRDQTQTEATRRFTLTIAGPLRITTSSPLPDGTQGADYSLQFAASGGDPPYRWAIIDSVTPPGLIFRVNGLLTGRPTDDRTWDLIVRVIDQQQRSDTQTFRLVILPGAPALTITTTSPLPEAMVGQAYNLMIEAANGTPPYTWSIIEGGPPPGLTLGSDGSLSGTPTQAGNFILQVGVADSEQATDSQVFRITVAEAGLSIVTGAFLPGGNVGQQYSQSLEATGGTPPYTWDLLLGAPPDGVTLGADGSLSGVPNVGGDFGFSARVTDSAGDTATRNFAITVTGLALPDASVLGLPDQTDPAVAQTAQVTLASPYPVALTGVATLTFVPDATVPVDDPAVLFASGGRRAEFSIPAGNTAGVFNGASSVGIQTGSVAGRIVVTVALFAGGTNITPDPAPSREMIVRQTAPVLQSVNVTRTGNGFNVQVVGISSPRDMTQATFTFTAAAGSNLQTTQATVNIGQVFSDWYQSAGSAPFGSTFQYTQPFNIQGDTNAVTGVSVTLSNSQGNSNAVSANF